MKISFIVLSLGCDIFSPPGSSITGGQAVFTKNLIYELVKKYDTTVVSLRFGNNCESLNHESYPFHIIEIPLCKGEYNNESLWDNFSEIEHKCLKSISTSKFNSSYVISIYWLSGLLITRNKHLNPKIWMHSFASYATQKSTEYNNTSYLDIRLKNEQIIGQKVDYLWATNQYEYNLLMEEYSFLKSKIIVIPRAVNQSSFVNLPIIDKYEWDVIFFGRLDKRKGIFDIPIMLQQITKRNVSFLVLGGTQNEIDNYKKWFEFRYPDLIRHHNIVFHNAVPQQILVKYILNSKLVFLPSHSETFANAVNESLILGRPVVTTYAGGIPEFHMHYDNCFSYDYRSPDTATELIEHVLDNHPKLINKPKIPHCYTWKNAMEIFDDTIKKHI